jgi:hypothetical protein
MFPAEVWEVVVGHSPLADVSRMGYVCQMLKRVVTLYLERRPPDIYDALATDSLLVLRAGFARALGDSTYRDAIFHAACSMRAWRIVVGELNHYPQICMESLIKAGCIDGAVEVSRRTGRLPIFQPELSIVGMHLEPHRREEWLNAARDWWETNVRSGSEYQEKVMAHLTICHPDDIRDFILKSGHWEWWYKKLPSTACNLERVALIEHTAVRMAVEESRRK